MINYNLEFWENKRVLITGHNGFLGSWLTKILSESGAQITGLDIKSNQNGILRYLSKHIKDIRGDISDLAFVASAINNYKPQIIFHLAAQAIVQQAVQQPRSTFKSNIEGTWNILDTCRNKKFIQSIIVASSDKAYGEHKNLPYKESMPLEGRYPYDVSKSCADLLVYSYFKTFGLPVCVTRCGNIYGGGDLHFSRLVPDLMRAVVRNKQFIIRSDGKFTRDYIYVQDVASGYILLAEKMKKLKLCGMPFNFSNEKPLSVLELFKKIASVGGNYNIAPKILNLAKYEIKNQYLSSKRAKKILGWKPEFTIEEGLRLTLEWYKRYFNR